MLSNAGARLSRAFSNVALDSKAFSDTLLLPKTSFPLRPDPSQNEALYRAKTSEELYRWQRKNVHGQPFVFHDGPPYANGDLHMGHALNKVLKDIINRFALLQGRKVQYVPGWDCHGLPIENKALQELGKDSSRVPASTIRAAAHAVAKREVASQKEQFRQFGIMADWDSDESTYRTLDHDYEMRQLRIFEQMVNNGLIHRRYRPVHYSPSSRSALAEAELVYKDNHVSHSVYVAFTLDPEFSLPDLDSSDGPIQLIVWTTTPWTLTANMGIAIHSDMIYSVVRRSTDSSVVIVAQSRLEALKDILGPTELIIEIPGSSLKGLRYRPIFSSLLETPSLEIINSSHVTSDSGTGLVHCAPAHGDEDYKLFQSRGLISGAQDSLVCHVNESAFTGKVANVVGSTSAQGLIGKPVLDEGSRAIVDLLKQTGTLLAVKRYQHRYPYDWKTDKPIIVTATSQWFANLDNIKGQALEALKIVSFYPDQSRNRLESFIQSRSEWCISRQRVWGVPIPALINSKTGEAILDRASLQHILSVLEEKGVSYWWDSPVDDFLPPALRDSAERYHKSTDTMDVWFDSGTSWSMMDLPENERSFRADVCLEGSDQHRGWFQSQLLTAVGSAPENTKPQSPYGALITHGMVLDENGKKMSKSLGNIVSPSTIVLGGPDKKKQPAYGADLLRLWAASVEYKNDMSIGRKALDQTAEAMRKIRNSVRFILGNIGDLESRGHVEVPRSQLGLAERFVMHELYILEKTALKGYQEYDFAKVTTALVNFANVTLSSLYFDITKDCLYANKIDSFERRAVVTVLEKILQTTTSVFAPILPHLAEETHVAYSEHRSGDSSGSFFERQWQPMDVEWEDPSAAKDMSTLLRIRKTVLTLLEKARGDKHLRSSLEADVDIILPNDWDHPIASLLRREEQMLKTLFITSDASVIDEGSLGSSSPEWIYSESLEMSEDPDTALGIRVQSAALSKCPRCWTFTRHESEKTCGRCKSVLEDRSST